MCVHVCIIQPTGSGRLGPQHMTRYRTKVDEERAQKDRIQALTKVIVQPLQWLPNVVHECRVNNSNYTNQIYMYSDS